MLLLVGSFLLAVLAVIQPLVVSIILACVLVAREALFSVTGTHSGDSVGAVYDKTFVRIEKRRLLVPQGLHLLLINRRVIS